MLKAESGLGRVEVGDVERENGGNRNLRAATSFFILSGGLWGPLSLGRDAVFLTLPLDYLSRVSLAK